MVPNNRTASAQSRPIWPVAAVIILLVGGVGYYIYNVTRPRPAAVERRDIVGYVAMKGMAVAPPSAYAEVRAPYSAPVDKIYVTLGAQVKRGDVLVELANPTAGETYEQAHQNVRTAETAYANAKQQYDDAVKAAQKQLDAARAAASSPDSSSQSSSVSTNTTENGSTVTTTTTVPTGDVATAEQAVEQAKSDRAAGLASYQQQLDTARAAYREARAGKRMSQLTAPISGTVIALNAQPGQTVGQNGAPVVTITDLSAVQVQAGMTPAQAGAVKTEMPVTLNFDTVPNKQFEGVVHRITTRADPSSSTGVLKGAQYVVLISFKNSEGLVKPQAVADVSVKAGEAKNALAVPMDAVHPDETGKPTVKVLEDGGWRTVAVQTGLSDGHYVQIKEGVKEGETVQVTPNLSQASSVTK